ncbi:MAG: glycosyltransferase family 2 protein [Betaproteobacteria bacterium]
MSTYNGERFVEAQIHSILDQLPAAGILLIRDDGSRDETVSRIEAFADARIHITCGENIGFSGSFLALMAFAPKDADMYMLADQDDVWMQNKIERAWNYIQRYLDKPILYCSKLRVVDEKLQSPRDSPIWPHPPSFRNALAENIVTGCTVAMNLPMLEIATKCSRRELIFFHDWWLYLVASAFGEVFYDEMPTILYRQHGTNVIGMGTGIHRYLAILRFLRRTNWTRIMINQVTILQETFGPFLSSQQSNLITRYFVPDTIKSRLRLIFSPARFRQRISGEIFFRMLMAVEFILKRT